MNKGSIMQWTVQSIRSRKVEIIEYIGHYKVNVMAVQETKLAEHNKFNHGTFNHTSHGVWYATVYALLIHSGVPYETIDINTHIQAVVSRVRLHSTITICNKCSPGAQALDRQMLEHIQRHLPQPFIMLGILTHTISCGIR